MLESAPVRSADIHSPTWAWLLILSGVAVHATFILEAKPLSSANDRSRWCTVWSLIERRTYRIDEIRQKPGWDTIDLVYDDGHFYSTKPPILATWVAGIAWYVCRVTGWTLIKNTQAVMSVTLLIANGAPLLLSWIILARLLRQSMTSPWGQGLLLTVAIFGTLLTPFAVTLNNHTVAAAGAMVTVYALWQILRNGKLGWGDFVLCGFAAGWTCGHELPAALLVAAAFLLCCSRDVLKTLIGFMPAALVPLGLFLLTNWLATGSIQPAYADYGTEKYRFVIDGVPSYWLEPKGIDRNIDSTPAYIWHCLIGHHGLFSLTPVWLLLIPGWIMGALALRGPDRKAQAYIPMLSLILTVGVLAFYFSRTKNYNYGGVCCGLRWALWLTPFWLATLIPLFNDWSESRVFRWAFVPLFLVSAFSAWSRVDNPWRQPWLFVWMESHRWINYNDPRQELPHDLWTWIAAVPDCRDGKPRWMEFVSANSPLQNPARMRLAASPTSTNAESLVHLQITRENETGAENSICDVEINLEKFLAGAKPADFLRWPNSEVSTARQQADLALIRGLPKLQKFTAGVTRYRKTPLRTDAFRCQHAFAAVETAAPTEHGKWRYRCDVWLCEELPFGVAEVEFQVQDVASGLLLHQEHWQAAACEPPALPHAQWSPMP